MSDRFSLDQTVAITVRRDEAIVLYHLLSREIWSEDEARLKAICRNDAEAHALRALLQELVPPLIDTGGPDWDDSHAAAVESVIARHR